MTRMTLSGAAVVALLLASGSAAFAANAQCGQGFMKDPCAADGYAVVETERMVRGPHNCMAIAHYFPGEEPEGYCGGSSRSKNAARAQTPVASVD